MRVVGAKNRGSAGVEKKASCVFLIIVSFMRIVVAYHSHYP